MVPTLRLCVLYGSQNKQQLCLIKHYEIGFITEVGSVYSAVRTESLYKTDPLPLYRVRENPFKILILAADHSFLRPDITLLSLSYSGNGSFTECSKKSLITVRDSALRLSKQCEPHCT
jgi:hypothetical protein